MDPTRSILKRLVVPEGVVDFPSGTTKDQALTTLARLACQASQVPPARVEEVLAAFRVRETVMSTGIGLGIAIPHVRHASAVVETIRVGRAREGIDFDALDRKPVHLVFAVLLPANQHRRHVQIVGEIVAALKPERRRAEVLAARGGPAFVDRLLAAP